MMGQFCFKIVDRITESIETKRLIQWRRARVVQGNGLQNRKTSSSNLLVSSKNKTILTNFIPFIYKKIFSLLITPMIHIWSKRIWEKEDSGELLL